MNTHQGPTALSALLYFEASRHWTTCTVSSSDQNHKTADYQVYLFQLFNLKFTLKDKESRQTSTALTLPSADEGAASCQHPCIISVLFAFLAAKEHMEP